MLTNEEIPVPEEVKEMIRELFTPHIPRLGAWIIKDGTATCSSCGKAWEVYEGFENYHNFCPYCGSRMAG